MALGICKLTGSRGKFVDAHILPKALTRLEKQGVAFIQAGDGTRPTRRYSSWYDQRLVTSEGEAILAKLDDWAIRILRENKLVWSGWGPIQSIEGLIDEQLPHPGWGLRVIHGVDVSRLRLFYLSLLWRAAASDRKEMSKITIPVEHLEALREMVLSGNPDPVSFYPVRLVQLSTLGPKHNHTPIYLAKDDRAAHGGLFRFYFDGLMAHVDVNASAETAATVGSMALGSECRMVVPAVRFELSFQKDIFEEIALEAATWPFMSRLTKDGI